MRMRLKSVVMVAILLTVALASSEGQYVALSASQTVGSTSFPRYTKTVVIVSNEGSDTCYFRLFTDLDTVGDATTSSAPIMAGESLTWTIYPECGGANSATCRDSESYVDNRRANGYRSLSYICASSESATWRVYYK